MYLKTEVYIILLVTDDNLGHKTLTWVTILHIRFNMVSVDNIAIK